MPEPSASPPPFNNDHEIAALLRRSAATNPGIASAQVLAFLESHRNHAAANSTALRWVGAFAVAGLYGVSQLVRDRDRFSDAIGLVMSAGCFLVSLIAAIVEATLLDRLFGRGLLTLQREIFTMEALRSKVRDVELAIADAIEQKTSIDPRWAAELSTSAHELQRSGELFMKALYATPSVLIDRLLGFLCVVGFLAGIILLLLDQAIHMTP